MIVVVTMKMFLHWQSFNNFLIQRLLTNYDLKPALHTFS